MIGKVFGFLMDKNKKTKGIAAETPSIANQSTNKKISFFSAMLIVMGSSIGAGIFFKAKGVLEASQGSLIFAILAWLIAAFAVISMALALVEIASARNDNLSLIGWCKVFNSRTIYKASKNFMFYIYLPLTYFFMPLYVILSFQDALYGFGATNSFMIGGTGQADWVIWTIISLAISAFFIFISGMSSRAGNIMNKGIMGVKFIPLFATIIIGFIIAGTVGGANASAGPVIQGGAISSTVNSTNFTFMSPGIGLFMAMGAIFFAYDGFYVTAGLQTEMKEPKKTPLAIVFGLGAVTIIYLMIAISMSITGNGGLFGFEDFLTKNNALWVFGVLNLTIAIGVLGIINGFAMWAPRFIEDLIRDDEVPFSQRFKNKLNANKPMVGIFYSIAVSAPIVILFSIVGALAYVNTYDLTYGSIEMGKLYTFADLMGTWTAVLAFVFIMLPIYGGLRNRKTGIVATEQKKYFLWSAWVSVILIGIVILFLVIDAFVNVFMLTNMSLAGWNDTVAGTKFAISKDVFFIFPSSAGSLGEAAILEAAAKGLKFENVNELTAAISSGTVTVSSLTNYEYLIGGDEGLVGRIMKLIVLLVFMAILLVPTIIEDKIHIKQYGSIVNYEKALNLEPTVRLA